MSITKKYKRLYGIWRGMRGRCQNPNRPKYSLYGARGITVCDEWQSFEAFVKWAIANGYQDDLTIDRIDNNGNYCPDNCRWATALEQCYNRSCSLTVSFAGENRTVKEVAEITGMDYYLLRARLRSGMSIEEAITTPKKTHKNHVSKGERLYEV